MCALALTGMPDLPQRWERRLAKVVGE